jgi:general secretion pathway protein G
MIESNPENPPILDYQKPRSDYQKVHLPVGKWFLGSFSGFILTFVFAKLELSEMTIAAMILTAMFNLMAFVRCAYTNRDAGLASAAIILLPIYVIILISAASHDHTVQARFAKAKTDIKSLEYAIEQIKIDMGRYPATDEGLDILVENPNSLENWKGPYIKYQLDPWGNDYAYQFPGKINPASFDIISAGPDGIPDTEDDLSN